MSKIDTLEITLTELRSENKVPDVLCFSETFIKKGDIRNVKLNGYELVSLYCREKSRGGVCIYVQKGIKCREINYIGKYTCDNVFECCGIEITDLKMFIICLYRTPKSKIDRFFKYLDTLLYKITFENNKKYKICFAGDININTLHNNKITDSLNDILQNYNLTSHINIPTRLNSCIDHILVTSKMLVAKC